jgi:DsbC/DsbD-like thiol-disulfide interchange protein
MNQRNLIQRTLLPCLATLSLLLSANCSNARTSNAASTSAPVLPDEKLNAPIETNVSTDSSNSAAAQQPPNINVEGSFQSSSVKRGGVARAQVTVEIPEGYHINANRPLGKYAIPTVLKISAPAGVRVSPVIYPRAVVRQFKFSNERLAVYEGRAVIHFNVTVPASYKGERVELKANLRFQSCNDEVCFPPKTRDLEMAIDVR